MVDRAHELARATLRKAGVDPRVAELAAADRDESEPWATCFHAQQAVEKGIKACLIAASVDFPKTHDLSRLLDLLPPDARAPLTQRDAAWLTDYATAGRYAFEDVAPGSDPDWADAKSALQIAHEVLDWARTAAEAGGWIGSPSLR